MGPVTCRWAAYASVIVAPAPTVDDAGPVQGVHRLSQAGGTVIRAVVVGQRHHVEASVGQAGDVAGTADQIVAVSDVFGRGERRFQVAESEIGLGEERLHGDERVGGPVGGDTLPDGPPDHDVADEDQLQRRRSGWLGAEGRREIAQEGQRQPDATEEPTDNGHKTPAFLTHRLLNGETHLGAD